MCLLSILANPAGLICFLYERGSNMSRFESCGDARRTMERGACAEIPGRRRDNVLYLYESERCSIIIRTPAVYAQVVEIAQCLCRGSMVLLNLQHCDDGTARRVLDFLSGVSYVNDYAVNQVASDTYLITPSEVTVLRWDERQNRRSAFV